MTERVVIQQIPSGVPGLDEVLGGGIPEYSFNLIAGGPGCGKTTLAHQILFASATPERPALYISVLGEPPLKMLRYQQQFAFFDVEKIGGCIHFLHLGKEALDGGLEAVLERILREVEATRPRMVVVDSFRAVVRRANSMPDSESELQRFMQRLALYLTSYEATTFLLGEYQEHEGDNNALFTVADGILWLYQAVEGHSVVRKLNVVKMRGQGSLPGLHTARITEKGFSVFPRLLHAPEQREALGPKRRLLCGVPALDEMMGGGIPEGYTLLISGPSGSGKTVLAHQFLIEGARQGELGILVVFERRPSEYQETNPHGLALTELVQAGQLEILYLRSLDLSIDETLLVLREAVLRTGARRAVIDSLSGLELALAPTFRVDFRESMYRLLGSLTALGVTVLATVELTDSYTELAMSPQGICFLADGVLLQRYVELAGQLRRVMTVVKLRASAHSKELREYELTDSGLTVLPHSLEQYEGLLTGRPRPRRSPPPSRDPS